MDGKCSDHSVELEYADWLDNILLVYSCYPMVVLKNLQNCVHHLTLHLSLHHVSVYTDRLFSSGKMRFKLHIFHFEQP